MHYLCPIPKNNLGKSFNHILKYLQISSLPNIPNCNTTYQLPYLRFISLNLWIQRDQFFSIKPCLITIASATSSWSYTIGLSCHTAHNTAPHVYHEYKLLHKNWKLTCKVISYNSLNQQCDHVLNNFYHFCVTKEEWNTICPLKRKSIIHLNASNTSGSFIHPPLILDIGKRR